MTPKTTPLWAGCLAILSLSAPAMAEQSLSFDANSRTLTATTDRLEIRIQSAALVGLRDLKTGETFSNLTDQGDIKEALKEMRRAERFKPLHLPDADTPVNFQQTSPEEGALIYRMEGKGQQWVWVRLEKNQEISLRFELRRNAQQPPSEEVHLPILGLKPQAVILGTGTRLTRTAPEHFMRCYWMDKNLSSPPVGIMEGENGVIALWPESNTFGYDDLYWHHRAAADTLIPSVALNGSADSSFANESGVTRSAWWRLAPLSDWLAAARRYRTYFEKKTGVLPLWLQSPAWVRDIHAVTTKFPATWNEPKAKEFYRDLASKYPVKKLLLRYLSDSLLLFGDVQYQSKHQVPSPAERIAIKESGFHWLGYHPYNLIHSPEGQKRRIEDFTKRNLGVPQDYVFTPEVAGALALPAFFEYWRDIAAGYHEPLEGNKDLWALHPGAKRFREYLARYVGALSKTYGMSACYLDTSGAEHGYFMQKFAPSDRRVIEGADWRKGEELAFRDLRKALPDLAFMSEMQSEWITAHAFYTYEGGSHVRKDATIVNHPLRTALWGSYTWTRCSDTTPEIQALLGGLPELNPEDAFSVAQAKLFMEEELYNALPAKWDAEALAYYRAKGGAWFQYRKVSGGYAYVEVTENGLKERLKREVAP